MGLYDTTGISNSTDIGDWLVSNMQEPLARTEGVGEIQVFGGQYAMRIWLDPFKLNAFALQPSDVEKALPKKLEADAGYSGLICKDPNHGHWKIAVWQPE